MSPFKGAWFSCVPPAGLSGKGILFFYLCYWYIFTDFTSQKGEQDWGFQQVFSVLIEHGRPGPIC